MATPKRTDYLQEFTDTSDYQSDPTGTLARRFIVACRNLRLLTPSSSATAQGGLTRFETGFRVEELGKLQAEAQAWLNELESRSPTATALRGDVARQFSLERFRGGLYDAP
ncbi:hypothetical protein [Schlesneria sp.]|uniref:hypothetical protein n=1 Tax=Schlesneria sp. TaxID=2762018 RepID=UPI002EEBBD02